jgi:hypothetical protein
VSTGISANASPINLKLYSVWRQETGGLPGIKAGTYYNFGKAAPGKQAEIRLLTDPPRQLYFERIALEDGFQLLDGFFIRNVTYVRTVIRHRGGPFRLENVNFVDCTFEFFTPAGRPIKFADKLIAQMPGSVSLAD